MLWLALSWWVSGNSNQSSSPHHDMEETSQTYMATQGLELDNNDNNLGPSYNWTPIGQASVQPSSRISCLLRKKTTRVGQLARQVGSECMAETRTDPSSG